MEGAELFFLALQVAVGQVRSFSIGVVFRFQSCMNRVDVALFFGLEFVPLGHLFPAVIIGRHNATIPSQKGLFFFWIPFVIQVPPDGFQGSLESQETLFFLTPVFAEDTCDGFVLERFFFPDFTAGLPIGFLGFVDELSQTEFFFFHLEVQVAGSDDERIADFLWFFLLLPSFFV